MKKALVITAAVVIVVIAGYYSIRIGGKNTSGSQKGELATYSRADVGLEFDYPVGSKGYVAEERMPVDLGEQPVKTIILMSMEDAQREPPAGGEGPAVITISVFDNTKKQFPRSWAEENAQYSNINLKRGDISEAVVGGANAIRYMADGLYASNNFVVAHGDSMYVITGQFVDENSDIRRDFEDLVKSIRFIPKPGQV